MAYSNPTPPYNPYSTTVPTFSPFYSSTIPPTYPNTYTPHPAPQPPPQHPNTISQTFPSIPTHTIHTPPTPTPSPLPSPQTVPPSRLEIKISIFDGSEDAYWWILCSEKFFNGRGLSDSEKILESGSAMRGCALTWWFKWYTSHPKASWDSFTTALLWYFKPEWRPILPIDGEEEPTVEETKQMVDSSDILSMTVPNINIFEEENKEEKERGSKTHHDSLSTSLCPKPLKKSLEITIYPASVPLSKPPDPPPKKVFSPLPLLPSPPRPPDKVLPLFLSPTTKLLPPPKPPKRHQHRLVVSFKTLKDLESTSSDLKSPLKIVSAPPPATQPPSKPPETLTPLSLSPRPPPKPPDLFISVSPESLRPPPRPPDLKPSSTFYSASCCLSFAMLSTEKMENTSSTIVPYVRVVGTKSQPSDYFIVVLLQLWGQLSPSHIPPSATTPRHVTCDYFLRNKVQLLQQNTMGFHIWAECNESLFCLGTIFMDKNHVSQVSLQFNLIGPLQTRPARKPPDLHLNLEDKVQVNPAAMIED